MFIKYIFFETIILKMVIYYPLTIQLSEIESNEFFSFLNHHQNVDSFQRSGNIFSIILKCSYDEFLAFAEGVKEIFHIKNIKLISLCKGRCHNNTICLNKAHYDGYCWRHR